MFQLKSNKNFNCLVLWLILLTQQPSSLATDVESEKLSRRDSFGLSINAGTVQVITGEIGATYARAAYDISTALDSDKVRFLVTLGKGSRSNVGDVLKLRGIDMGIAQFDVLDAMTIMDNNEKLVYSNADIRAKICYVTALYEEEVHIVSLRNNPDSGKELLTAADLEGLNVSIGQDNSGSQYTAKQILNAIGLNKINTNIVTDWKTSQALEKLEETANQNGSEEGQDYSNKIHAVIFVAGAPVAGIKKLSAYPNMKLLPISKENRKKIIASKKYYDESSFLNSTVYPNFYEKAGKSELGVRTVGTVSVSSILFMYNWEIYKNEGKDETDEKTVRKKKTNNAIPRILSAIGSLAENTHGHYHEKWKDVNVSENIDGWTRCPAAEKWVNENRQ